MLVAAAAWLRAPLPDLRLRSIWVNEVAVGAGMMGIELAGKGAEPVGVMAEELAPPCALLRPLTLTLPMPIGCVALVTWGDSPVGDAAVLRGLEPLDRNEVKIEGRKCEVVSDSMRINSLLSPSPRSVFSPAPGKPQSGE